MSENGYFPHDGIPLGQRLIHRHCITQSQLEQALEYQKNHPMFLGAILVTLGMLTQSELSAFFHEEAKPRIGELLVSDYGLKRQQLSTAISYQRKHGGRLGQICVQLGYITPEQLKAASSRQTKNQSLIGEELLQRGVITQEQLNSALAKQKSSGGRLGEILLYQGAVSEKALYRTLADIQQMGRAGEALPSQDIPTLPYQMAKRLRAIIIGEEKNYLIVAVEQQLSDACAAEIEDYMHKPVEQILTSPGEFFSFWQQRYKERESHQSVFGLYEKQAKDSAIVTLTTGQIVTLLVLLILVCLSFVIFRQQAILVIMIVLQAIYMLMAAAKFYIVIRGARKDAQLRFTANEVDEIDEQELPVYTVLIPVYKEKEVIHRLLQRIGEMDYPQYKLDVRILLEEDDTETIALIEQMDLPFYFTPVVVPHSIPKTKPKACNYGLINARGEYVVIYDAEDRPEPDQLKKAYLAFKHLPKEYVCIQAKLNYFNSNQNWLTRLFTQEYSMWFELLLVGIMQVDIPIPLGGTSNHFRASFLKEVGGWDPFNVTEDADLGIRLYKYHYKTAVLDSRTWEEANSNLGNWIRQRSRWIKGYMQTFFVHMRNPVQFCRALGFKGVLGYMAMVFGTPFLPLINPIFWTLLLLWVLFQPFWIQSMFPGLMYYVATIQLVFSNFVFVYINMLGSYYVIRDCALKKRQPFSYSMIRYGLLTPLYWVFMSIAAYKALFQLFYKPFYWEKTNHGLTKTGVSGNKNSKG